MVHRRCCSNINFITICSEYLPFSYLPNNLLPKHKGKSRKCPQFQNGKSWQSCRTFRLEFRLFVPSPSSKAFCEIQKSGNRCILSLYCLLVSMTCLSPLLTLWGHGRYRRIRKKTFNSLLAIMQPVTYKAFSFKSVSAVSCTTLGWLYTTF